LEWFVKQQISLTGMAEQSITKKIILLMDYSIKEQLMVKEDILIDKEVFSW